MSSRPSLPTSAKLLGWVINGLRLQPPLRHHVPDTTLRRVLRGEIVKAETRHEVIEALVQVFLPDPLLATWGLVHDDTLGTTGPEVRARVVGMVEDGLDAWDASVGTLRSVGPPVADARFAVLPWVRLLFLEIALRVAAYLRVFGVAVGEDDAKALVEGRAFVHLVQRYRGAARGLPRDTIAREAKVARSTVDQWLGGHALPRPESVLNLAALMAKHVPHLSESEAELHLRVCVGASELVRVLQQSCVPGIPDPDIGPNRADSFAILFTTALASFGRMLANLPIQRGTEGEFLLWLIVVEGSQDPVGRELASALLDFARDSHLRADLHALVTGQWTDRVLLTYRQLPQVDSVVHRVGVPNPPESHRPMLEEARAWGVVTPNPNGWLLEVVPPLELPDYVVMLSSEAFPDHPEIMGKHAMEAVHLHGDPEQALLLHRRLVEQDPGNPKYAFWYGCSLAELGHLDDALIALRMACALDPDWSLPAVEVAVQLANAGKLEQALASIESTSKQYPVDARLAYTHAWLLLRGDDLEGAVPWFRRVLDLQPEHALATRDLAHCLLSLGERQEGRRLAKQAAHAGQPVVLDRLTDGGYDS